MAHQIDRLPVDLRGIADQNGWKLLSFENHKQLALALDRVSPFVCDGWTVIFRDEVFIFFREKRTEGRNRFTVAHEFGHLALHHLSELKREEYEQEANMFAARILMPLCVLKECHAYKAEEIASLCHTSLEAATYRAKRLKYVTENSTFYKSPLERQVAVRFKKYILEINKRLFPPRPFHRILSKLRAAHGFTQNQTAERLEITLQEYSAFERGECEPDIAHLVKMGQIFDVSLNYLLGADLPKDNIEIIFQALTIKQRQRVIDFIHGMITDKD